MGCRCGQKAAVPAGQASYMTTQQQSFSSPAGHAASFYSFTTDDGTTEVYEDLATAIAAAGGRYAITGHAARPVLYPTG